MTKMEVSPENTVKMKSDQKVLVESSIGYYDAHRLLKFENDCGRNNKVEMNFSFIGEWPK